MPPRDDGVPTPGRVLLFFVALGVLTRLVLLPVPIVNIDEASYIVGSWEILDGKLPYLDFGDNKPPLVYLYYALAQLLLGEGMLSVRILTSVCIIPLTAFGVSAFFEHSRRGVVAGGIFLIYSAAFRGHDMLAVNCEILMLLPLAWAVVLVRDEVRVRSMWYLAGAGALIAMGTLFKYQAASWLPAIAAAVLLGARRPAGVRRTAALLASLLAGFAAPLALTCGIFTVLGAGAGFYYWNVAHNLAYVANPVELPDIFTGLVQSFGPFVVVTAPLWIAAVRSWSVVGASHERRLLAGLIVGSLVSVTVGFRFFPHYFVQLYVPLALASGPALAVVLRQPMRPVGWVLAAYTTCLFTAFTASDARRYLLRQDVHLETRPVFEEVTHRLQADICFGDGPLFVWGNSAPLFYYTAQLPVASRFFFPESPLVAFMSGNPRVTAARAATGGNGSAGAQEWDWLVADLRESRPTYILDTAPAHLDNWHYFPLGDSPRLMQIVRDAYVELDVVRGVVIYRRTGCETEAAGVLEARRAPLKPPTLYRARALRARIRTATKKRQEKVDGIKRPAVKRLGWGEGRRGLRWG